MGSIKTSKGISLLVWESKNAQTKVGQKRKEKKNTDFKPKEDFDPSNGALGSNKEKHQRFDKSKHSYCNKGNHTEKGCTKKTLDQMSIIGGQHNMSLLEGTRKYDYEGNTKDNEIFHTLNAIF